MEPKASQNKAKNLQEKIKTSSELLTQFPMRHCITLGLFLQPPNLRFRRYLLCFRGVEQLIIHWGPATWTSAASPRELSICMSNSTCRVRSAFPDQTKHVEHIECRLRAWRWSHLLFTSKSIIHFLGLGAHC